MHKGGAGQDIYQESGVIREGGTLMSHNYKGWKR